MAKITWSPKSLKCMEDKVDYISLDSPNRAVKWTLMIFEEVEKIKDFPFSCREVPEINNPNIRELIKNNYRIVYEIRKKNIEILVVRNFAKNKIFD